MRGTFTCYVWPVPEWHDGPMILQPHNLFGLLSVCCPLDSMPHSAHECTSFPFHGSNHHRVPAEIMSNGVRCEDYF